MNIGMEPSEKKGKKVDISCNTANTGYFPRAAGPILCKRATT